jgi:hypothetical protein
MTADMGDPDTSPQFVSPGPALRDHARAELEAAITALDRHGRHLHAGVHRARKALRRVRATLALGRAGLGPGARLVDRELRRINRELSVLRDAQALVETLDRLRKAHHDDPDSTALLHRARRAATARRTAVTRDSERDDPARARHRALLTALGGALSALPWPVLTSAMVDAAIAVSDTRAARAQARARAGGRDEDWHRWRRRSRRQSQQRRALKVAGLAVRGPPVAASAFDKTLTKLLGDAQDLNLLLEHCGRRSPFSKSDRAALRRFAMSEQARLRERIIRAAGPA